MPYPPGISRRDLKRAGIIEGPEPECLECENIIDSIDDHAEWCENRVGTEEILEQLAEDAIATEYDPVEHKL